MTGSTSDARKRLAESQAEAQTVDEVEALAKVLGDARIAEARQADWWTSDEDHALLARVLRAEVEPWAAGILAAGYLSPTAVREREAAAWDAGWNAMLDAAMLTVALGRKPVETPNPFRGSA